MGVLTEKRFCKHCKAIHPVRYGLVLRFIVFLLEFMSVMGLYFLSEIYENIVILVILGVLITVMLESLQALIRHYRLYRCHACGMSTVADERPYRLMKKAVISVFLLGLAIWVLLLAYILYFAMTGQI